MTPSLYIHIPFCAQKCDYCDFFSIPLNNCENIKYSENYVDSVLNELNFYKSFFSVDSWKTIYIGGGTPSKLSPSLLEKLIINAKKTPSEIQPLEITVEANPQDITIPFIQSLKSAGVTRISMGIQGADDKALKKINRGCSEKNIFDALNLLESHWDKDISVDFIAGLPGQTYSSFSEQFDKILSYHITHVSLYTLTVEEGTPLFNKISDKIISFSQEKCDKMWNTGKNILKKKGFHQYEISNFSIPGKESIHNSSYWQQDDYIGCGCTAAGTIYGKTGLRWNVTKNIHAYENFWLQKNESKNETLNSLQDKGLLSIEKLSKETMEFEFLMMGLRMNRGISLLEFKKRFGKTLEESVGEKINIFREWENEKLAKTIREKNDVRYALNSRGIMLLNRFLESLL